MNEKHPVAKSISAGDEGFKIGSNGKVFATAAQELASEGSTEEASAKAPGSSADFSSTPTYADKARGSPAKVVNKQNNDAVGLPSPKAHKERKGEDGASVVELGSAEMGGTLSADGDGGTTSKDKSASGASGSAVTAVETVGNSGDDAAVAGGAPEAGQGRGAAGESEATETFDIYVGNLSWDVTEDDLATLFAPLGASTRVRGGSGVYVIRDRLTNRSVRKAFWSITSAMASHY